MSSIFKEHRPELVCVRAKCRKMIQTARRIFYAADGEWWNCFGGRLMPLLTEQGDFVAGWATKISPLTGLGRRLGPDGILLVLAKPWLNLPRASGILPPL